MVDSLLENRSACVVQHVLILLWALTLSTIQIKAADTLRFSSASYTTDEFSQGVLVDVVRTNPSTNFVTVVARTSPGTATLGSDYAAMTATLTFYGGDTIQGLWIPIYEDTLAEGDETVLLTLSNPTGGAVLGSPSSAVLTIRNGGARVEFQAPSYQAKEGDGPATITVRRRGDDNVAFSVEFLMQDGAATAGEDYTPVSGSIEFAAGEILKTLTVPILDDGSVEPPETVQLVLTNATHGVVLGAKTATLEIIDNEIPASLDYSFNPAIEGDIYTIAAQPDGKILVGGRPTSVNGQPVGAVARLHADGSLDDTFKVDVTLTSDGKEYPGTVGQIFVLPAGKLLIRGSFDKVSGVHRAGAARLNADGSLDTAFEMPSETLGSSAAILPLPDGKILRAREAGIVRVNADGSLDNRFSPTQAANGAIYSIALQLNGKILVGGDNGVVRLNTDGSADESFDHSALESWRVMSILVQPDDKVLVAGYLKSVSGYLQPGFVRLNADGALDSGFSTPENIVPLFNYHNPSVDHWSLPAVWALQPDGGILVNQWSGILRLKGNGTLEQGFVVAEFKRDFCYKYCAPTVGSMLVQPDGRILIRGAFYAINGARRNGLARLNADPSRLNFVTFVPDGSVGAEALGSATVRVQRLGNTTGSTTVRYATVDGSATGGADYVSQTGTITFAPLEVTKTFTFPVIDDGLVEEDETIQITLSARDPRPGAEVDPRPGLVPILDDERPGSLDFGFAPEVMAGVRPLVAVQPDGKILLAVVGTNKTEEWANDIVRVNADGSVDSRFVSPFGPDDSVTHLAVQRNGQAIVGGYTYGSGNWIRRLNLEGSLDPTFKGTLPTNVWINSLVLESDGNVLVQYAGGTVAGLGRLRPDGVPDSGFHPPAGLGDSGFYQMTVQPDGSVVIYGRITFANQPRLALLRPDGSIDPGFDPALDPEWSVSSLISQADGRILIGGYFSSVNGVRREGLARLNADGSLDTTFKPDSTLAGNYELMLQRDGKVLVVRSYYGSDRIFRLNPDGSLDRSFKAGSFTVADCASYNCLPAVSAVALQPDSKVVVVGNFSTISGISRPGIARLNGDERYARLNLVTPMTDGSVRVTITSQPNRVYLLQGSTDLRQWIDLRTKRAGDYTLELDDVGAASFERRFYRVMFLTP
jgi:uncharacterized delta-60 repeat protein